MTNYTECGEPLAILVNPPMPIEIECNVPIVFLIVKKMVKKNIEIGWCVGGGGGLDNKWMSRKYLRLFSCNIQDDSF